VNDASSELDQEEIMKLKKRLDFIEISNCSGYSKNTTPSHKSYESCNDQRSTPKMGGSRIVELSGENNKENRQHDNKKSD
jgi:hypothetical protein